MVDVPSVPAADEVFPAAQQQAQVDAANGRMPEPSIPKANAQHEPAPDSQAAQMLPNTANTPAQRQPAAAAPVAATPAPDSDVPQTLDEALAQQAPKDDDVPQNLDDALAQQKQNSVQDATQFKLPDNSAMAKYVGDNFQVYNASNTDKPVQPDQHPANNMLEAIESGLQISTAGLGIRQKMPDVVLPENASRAYRIASQIGQLAGDMPAMALGGLFGGLAGGAAGTAELPVVGTVAGAAVGSSAGAFALPAALRKIMIDHYEKGDIQTAGEFTDRLMATTWEGAKGAITGAATALTGGAASVVGPMAKIGTELATMTTVGAALEGHLPSAQDFMDGAIVIGGLHGAGMVSGKLRNIYAQTGERPEQILAAAKTNPELKQQLLSHDMEQPEQSAPTDIEHVPLEQSAEDKEAGKEPEVNRNQLVPQDLEIETPKPPNDDTFTDAEKSIKSMIGTEKVPEVSVTDRIQNNFNSIYAKNVDWTDPLKVDYAAWREATGKELTAEEDPHKQARLFAGHTEFLRRVINDGIEPNGDFKPDSDSLTKIYKDVPDDEQGKFDLYSIAKRAVELDDQGKNPGANFNRTDAEQVIKDGSDKYQELHERRVQVMNNVLDYGVSKGVLDPDIVKASKENNENYVPFNRIIPPDELTGEIGGNGKLLNKIEGSELDIKDPRQGFYNNIAAIIRRSEINDIRTKYADNLKIDATNEDGVTFKENPFVREVPVTGALGKNQVAIFRDGKMSALEGSELTIDSLKRLESDPGIANLAVKIAAKMATVARVGATSDPGFSFRHNFRSTLMSGAYTQTGQIPFVHQFMAMGEFMKGESETYKNFLSDGGATSGFDELKASYVDNGLQEADSKYPFVDKAWNVIKKPFEASEAFIKMSDNLSRFAEYKRALDQGQSRDQAAFLAREVTPDFAKQGLERSAMRSMVAFMGAHINSMDRFRQAIVEDPEGVAIWSAGMIAATSALYAANKDDKEIQDLPQYQRDLYWCVNVSRMFNTKNDQGIPYDQQPDGMKTGTIFRLPKPWGPGILVASGVERTLDHFFNKNPHAFDGYGHALLESVLPSIIPTIAQPVMDQFANKNSFSGRQLVSNDQMKELPEMQYQPYTHETSKQLAKLISYVPGVKDIGPNGDTLSSPAVVENYIQGWTGLVGGWALKIGDEALKTAGVTPPTVDKATTPLAEEPILNEFMTRFPSMKEQPVQTFYENYDKNMAVMNSIKASMKQGNFDQAQSIMAANPGMELKLDSISKTISAGRKSINQIQSLPNISPDQKRQLVDSVLFQIGSAAKMGNQMMDSFQKQIDTGSKK